MHLGVAEGPFGYGHTDTGCSISIPHPYSHCPVLGKILSYLLSTLPASEGPWSLLPQSTPSSNSQSWLESEKSPSSTPGVTHKWFYSNTWALNAIAYHNGAQWSNGGVHGGAAWVKSSIVVC